MDGASWQATRNFTPPFSAAPWMQPHYGGDLGHAGSHNISPQTEASNPLHEPRGMFDTPTVPAPLLFAANYQRGALPQGPEDTMSFVPSALGYSTLIPTIDTEPFIGTSTNYDDGARSFSAQVHANPGDWLPSAHFDVQHSEDTVSRQVGSPAGTKASKARRCGQRRPRFFCDSPGCTSEGFTARHNYRYHVLAHKGEKPFPCNRCGRTFRSHNDLSRHQRKYRPCQCSNTTGPFQQSG